MIVPHFNHYAPYIWSAYGIVLMALLITSIWIVTDYRRALLNDIDDEC